VLDALAAVGLYGNGRLLQLNSFENRVYRVHLEDEGAVVAKFYRPCRWSDAQILEEHAFARELCESELPVVAPRVLAETDPSVARLVGVPPTLAHLAIGTSRHRVAVTDLYGGGAPELDDPATLEWLGRFLGRLHAVGHRAPFIHRATLGPDWSRSAQRRLLDMDVITRAELAAWHRTSDEALSLVESSFARLPTLRRLRIHGDMHRGNVIWRDVATDDRGPHIVDLDDSCNGPAVQDLWMLLSGDHASANRQLVHLLHGYRMFTPFDSDELALVEPLRTLRMINYSTWIAERWGDPAFPAAFPWFGTAAYWAQQIANLREQIDAMRGPSFLD
jgi:Ser/Thr protein kinase RdoA (MazF antagonist)